MRKKSDPDPGNPLWKAILDRIRRDPVVRLPAAQARGLDRAPATPPPPVAPGTPTPKVFAAYNSPFIQDTILPVLGNPEHAVSMGEPPSGNPDVLAFIEQRGLVPSSNIRVTSEGERQDPRALENSIAHELAHVANFFSPEFSDFIGSMSPEFWSTPASHTPANRQVERPAYAFENAVGFLRSINSVPREDWVRELARTEEVYPGTTEMMRRLVNYGDTFAGSRGMIPSNRVIQAAQYFQPPAPPAVQPREILSEASIRALKAVQGSSHAGPYRRMASDRYLGEAMFRASRLLENVIKEGDAVDDQVDLYKAWLNEDGATFPGFKQIMIELADHEMYRDLPGVVRFREKVLK